MYPWRHMEEDRDSTLAQSEASGSTQSNLSFPLCYFIPFNAQTKLASIFIYNVLYFD